MKGLALVLVALLGTCVSANNSTNGTGTADDANTNPDYDMPSLNFGGDMSAVLGSLQAQQYISNAWATTILELQSSMGWASAAGAYGAAALAELQKVKELQKQGDLPADATDEVDVASLEEETKEQRHMRREQTKAERQFEEEFFLHPYQYLPLTGYLHQSAQAGGDQGRQESPVSRGQAWQIPLLSVLKIMYVQSAHKMTQVQKEHYQMRVQATLVQGMGASPLASQLVFMMYYKNYLDVAGSSLTLQRYDAWSYWLFNEMMFTNEFIETDPNHPFGRFVDKTKQIAMDTYLLEASVELQSVFLDMVIKGTIAQATGGSALQGSFGSFMELGAQEKPFVPFVAASYPQMFAYYAKIFRFYERVLNFYTAQSMAHAAGVATKDYVRSVVPTAQSATLLQQWAQTKYFAALYEMYLLFVQVQGAGAAGQGSFGSFGGSLGAANLVQTDAATTTAAPAEEAPAAAVAEPAQPAPVQSLIADPVVAESAPAVAEAAPAAPAVAEPVQAVAAPEPVQQPQSLIG